VAIVHFFTPFNFMTASNARLRSDSAFSLIKKRLALNQGVPALFCGRIPRQLHRGQFGAGIVGFHVLSVLFRLDNLWQHGIEHGIDIAARQLDPPQIDIALGTFFK